MPAIRGARPSSSPGHAFPSWVAKSPGAWANHYFPGMNKMLDQIGVAGTLSAPIWDVDVQGAAQPTAVQCPATTGKIV